MGNCFTQIVLTCGNKHADKHYYAFPGTVRHCYSEVGTALLLLLTCLVHFSNTIKHAAKNSSIQICVIDLR